MIATAASARPASWSPSNASRDVARKQVERKVDSQPPFSSLLQIPGNLLRLPEGAEQVAAQHLVNVLLRVAAIEQFLRDVRKARDVFELLRHRVDAVEVRPQPDVIDPRGLDD